MVYPRRRMRHEDPWAIWIAAKALRIKEIIYKDRAGKPSETPDFYAPESIARQLYSNWEELSEREQELVLICKLYYPIDFLKRNCYLSEKWSMKHYPWDNRTYYIKPSEQIWHGVYHANLGAFAAIKSWTFEHRAEVERNSMKRSWDEFRGRSSEQLLARLERRLAKAA